MVAPEGREYASYLTLKAAEALVRSLVGVAGVSLKADANGVLREIVIIPAPGASDRSVGRDVRSALKARFGLSLDPGTITIVGHEADTDEQRTLDPDWRDSSVSEKGRDENGAPGRPERNGDVPGSSDSAVNHIDPEPASSPTTGSSEVQNRPAGTRPDQAAGMRAPAGAKPDPLAGNVTARVPRLEQVDVETLERGLRCRITIGVGEDMFHGVAEAPTGFTAEAELAARVTLDALRSARTPREPMQFRGLSLIDLAGRPHVAVSLAVWTGSEFEPLAGAEPVGDSVAEAAARAVIGSVIAHRPGDALRGA